MQQQTRHAPELTLMQLEALPIEQLKAMHISLLGTEPHHKAGTTKIATDILMAQQSPRTATQQIKPVVIKPVYFTKEQIEANVSDFVQRGLSVQVDDETWTFRNGKAIDSGHVSVPLSVQRMSAEMLMQARFPAKIKIDGEEVLA